MAETLEPCPFCGGAPKEGRAPGDKGTYWVGCENRRCPVEPTIFRMRRSDAIRLWNRRPQKESKS